MTVDPPKDESVTALLHEIGKTLQENQRFLAALKLDRLDQGDLGAEVAEVTDEEFEEL
jgi:hypothetical protein